VPRIDAPAFITTAVAVVFGAMAASLYAISSGLIIEPPAVLTRAVNNVGQWFARRTGAVAEPAQ